MKRSKRLQANEASGVARHAEAAQNQREVESKRVAQSVYWPGLRVMSGK